MNASHSVVLKKHLKTNKIETKDFFENHEHTFVDKAMILVCTEIQREVLMFGEVAAPGSSFWE